MFAVQIVTKDGIAFESHNGFADEARQVKAGPDTMFVIVL